MSIFSAIRTYCLGNNRTDILFRYDNADFAIRLKAKFTAILCITVIFSMLFFLPHTVYQHLANPNYGSIYLPILLPELLILVMAVISLRYLIKGSYNISVHLILNSTIILIWTSMFLDRGDAISRLDSIVFILVMLTTFPLLVERFDRKVILNLAANVIILVIYTVYNASSLSLSKTTTIDYLADNVLAVSFVSVIGFFIHRINNQILDKAVKDIRQRLEVEKALTESEGKFKEFTDLLPQTVFESDIDGNLLYINNLGLEVFGYSEENIEEVKNIFCLVSEADCQRAKKNFMLIIKGEKVSSNEYIGRKRDGSQFPIEVFAKPFFSGDSAVGIRGIAVDISERVAYEQALIESERKYRVLFENAHIGIYQTTPGGEILHVNPAIFKMTGYSSIDEMKSINLEDKKFYYDSRREEFKAMMEHHGEVKDFESVWLRKNGEQLNIIENATAVRDGEGKIIYYDGFVENITLRKKAETELKQSEERYRTILEAFPEMILLTDLNWNIVYSNRPFKQITGISQDNGTVIDLVSRFHENDRERVMREVDHLIGSSAIHTDPVEYRFEALNGNTRWFSSVFSKTILNDQLVVQSIIRDITENKNIESELQDYRENLEILVVKRTEEIERTNEELRTINEELHHQSKELANALSDLQLTQNKLIQSEKMASLGVLAAGIAHEINNPLNFIQGGIAGIESYFKSNLGNHIKDVRPLIDAVNTGVKRSASIVTSLNHYSRKEDQVYVNCNLNFIIENCLTMISNRLKNRIEVRKFLTDADYTLSGSDGKLHQAFLNILINAAQAIESNGTISICTTLEKTNIIARIEDTGCGIRPENIDKIFDPFFTTKEPGKGTGLGLSITYKIIKEHNGTIECDSHPGKGTAFTIRLPINGR